MAAMNGKPLLVAGIDVGSSAIKIVILDYDPQKGKLITLDSDQADYKSITWRKDADDLAAFKESKYEEDEDTTRQVLTWRRLNRKKSSHKAFDHLNYEDFPSEFHVVDFVGLKWSDDGKRIF